MYNKAIHLQLINSGIFAPSLNKRGGSILFDLLIKWDLIVGVELLSQLIPVRICYNKEGAGKLVLLCSSHLAKANAIYYKEELINNINQFFGFMLLHDILIKVS